MLAPLTDSSTQAGMEDETLEEEEGLDESLENPITLSPDKGLAGCLPAPYRVVVFWMA